MKQGNQISCQLNNGMMIIITGFSSTVLDPLHLKIQFDILFWLLIRTKEWNLIECTCDIALQVFMFWCVRLGGWSHQAVIIASLVTSRSIPGSGGRGPSLNNPGQAASEASHPWPGRVSRGNVWPGHPWSLPTSAQQIMGSKVSK